MADISNNPNVWIKAKAENYWEGPSLEDYLDFRKTFPSARQVESTRFAQLEIAADLDEELEQYGIPTLRVMGCLDGDKLEIDQLSLILIEKIVERIEREANGETTLQARKEVIPDTLIDYLVVIMLECCNQHDFAPCPSLVILSRNRLGGDCASRFRGYERNQFRQTVILTALLNFDSYEQVSIRKLAQTFGVPPSTISRLFEPGEFRKEFELLKPQFDAVSQQEVS